MPRTAKEWIGRTDDSKPPRSVYERAWDRCGGLCEGCGVGIFPKPWELDHRVRLKDGGENRESNFQVLCLPCHRDKTADENKLQGKANRVRRLTLGIKKRTRGGFKGWRKMDGTVVWKDVGK